MPGGQYIALSGMRTRLDQLDRLASDLANVGTTGYKAERWSHLEADRPVFDAALQSAIDVTTGTRSLDVSAGAINPTGRNLDVAIDGKGFFTVQTPAGTRYTRNGNFSTNAAGVLVTADGGIVQGITGPLTLGPGKVEIDPDGSVRAGETTVGRLAIVQFADPRQLVRETGAVLRVDAGTAPPTAVPANQVSIRSGALEQSNVSVVERVAELTNVTRNFEAMQKAVSLMMNDVYGQAIAQLGRR
jgi:flagellar basal-body rod protein FlgF